MTGPEIATVLGDTETWHFATSHERGAFAHEMKDRQYGWDALTQAWAWFHAGWRASAKDD